jgi:hypothetical protein
MAKKIRTEADAKATPRALPKQGTNANSNCGQKSSQERGAPVLHAAHH